MQEKEKITISINKELIKEVESERIKKTDYPRTIDNRSVFIEKLIVIGLNAYIQKQSFFDKVNINNIDLSKVNF